MNFLRTLFLTFIALSHFWFFAACTSLAVLLLDGRRRVMNDHADTIARIGFLGGSGATATGWITSVDWIAAIGAAVLVASFFVNLIFRRRDDRRKQERHDLEMSRLRDEQR